MTYPVTPTYSNTRVALSAYDNCIAEYSSLVATAPFDVLWAHLNKERELAAAVGHAYWLDTSGINNRATCEALVRPAPWLYTLLNEQKIDKE
jgi:hypothetical protein